MTEIDPRAARSRAALVEAMIGALDEGTLPASISITDIVKLAAVSRPTFYQHFKSMSALVHAAALMRLNSAFALVPAPDPQAEWETVSHESMTILLTHLTDYSVFYLAVLHDSGITPVSDIIDILATRFLDVAPFSPAIRADNEAARERAEFLAAGITWSVVRWLEAGGTDLQSAAHRFSAILISSVPASRAA
ncbi:AcrR family transcriptional regulator [Leucobacter exalbidus]|uniref:AcrR family transcriptional regulator n=1 Tax=Leucobacter exalbidus TaxID=662960 RepID=A0A940PVV4_9MICO|nr:TetR/AcrR family transcriptional regulator [Leucobacter exalbidus]MBP1327185.1 AcrR family transcriptional regulator [Leucobacter exalbidus]